MLIDENTFKVLNNTIKKVGWLELPAYGNSMFPFIQQGNICRFVPCDPTMLKKGEVILYYSQANRLIAHRLVEVKGNHPSLFLLKGDTNLGVDIPIGEERILGKLASVQKLHVNFTSEHFLANLWGKTILSFPILSGILRKLLNQNLQF